MSSNRLERIKGLRTKGSNNYLDLVPFGTSGQLVDMFSDLDLEEELRLGGNRYIELKEQENQFTIVKEWYYTEPKGIRSKAEMREFCGYSVKTVFSEVPLTSALQGDDEDQVIINSGEEGNIIVVDDDELRTIIDISLYKGDMEEIKDYEYDVKEWEYDPEYPEGSEGAEQHRTPVSYWSEEDQGYEEHRTPIYNSPIHNKTIIIDPPNTEGVEILNEDLVEGGE